MKINLLKETEETLKKNGKSLSDIEWVGCPMFQIDIGQFLNLADVDYDAGFGAPEVATDLLVVGKDFWLERHEYDGCEWWKFKTCPAKPNDVRNVHTLVGGAWDSLSQLNEEDLDEEEDAD